MKQSPEISPTKLAEAASISVPYAHQLLLPEGAKNRRRPSLSVALRIYDATGLKFGQIANATPEEIRILARMQERAA